MMLVKYSVATRLFHWLTALVVMFLFALGLWMDSLDYYHQWYQKAPELHVGVGVGFVVLLVLRGVNRLAIQRRLSAIVTLTKFERIAAKVIHILIYLLLVFMAFSGYWLAGLDTGAVAVFDWFELPGVAGSGVLGNSNDDAFSDSLKEWHELAAKLLIFIAIGHGAMAIKHHVLNKDQTLKRMI